VDSLKITDGNAELLDGKMTDFSFIPDKSQVLVGNGLAEVADM
jgi:hypothetical protein